MAGAHCLHKNLLGPLSALCVLLRAATSFAQAPITESSEATTSAQTNAEAQPHGSKEPGPTVILDKLEFPVILGASKYEKYLRQVLRKEAAQADWGAGPDSTIEYRFVVKSLSVEQKDDVLSVRCVATGTLPRGRRAQSQLSFGGSPRQHSELVRKVLAIVARGVVTRLAEIERVRRGMQPEARVIPPGDAL